MTDRQNEKSEKNGHDGHDEEERASRRKAAAYQGAFEAALVILVSGFAGKLADDHFGTEPRYLLVGFLIGFCAFVLRLVRLGRTVKSLAEEPDSDSEQKQRETRAARNESSE